MPVTIRDVAAAAGVSTATVSRALHDDAGVAARTRERVQQVAARLEYRPSPVAARLRTRRQGAVAVLAPSALPTRVAATLAGVVSVLAEHRFDCALTLVDEGAVEIGRLFRDLEGRVDAAVVLSLGAAGGGFEAAIPLVFVGEGPPGQQRVTVDEALSADLVTRHLDGSGYRRVAAVVDDNAHGRRVAESLDAAASRLRRRPPLLRRIPSGHEQADRVARTAIALLTASRPPDVLVCSTERIVLAAHRALLRHRLKPGEDVGLVGYGTAETAVDLGVTTVVEPLRELGILAAVSALQLIGIEHPEQPGPALQPHLLLGPSTARIRQESVAR